MLLSTNVEKTLDKIQYPFMTAHSKPGIKGNSFNWTKNTYTNKLMSHLVRNSIFYNVWEQYQCGFSHHSNSTLYCKFELMTQTRKGNKKYTNWEVKKTRLALACRRNYHLCRQSQIVDKKLLKLTRKDRSSPVYKVHIHKSGAFVLLDKQCKTIPW